MPVPAFPFDLADVPALDQSARGGTLPLNTLRAHVEALPAAVDAVRRRVAYGLLCLWHDHWEEAHAVAQEDEGEPDHDLLHAIAHRREQDFENSRYWFRRAGASPSHARLAARAEPLLRAAPNLKLLRDGKWNALAFLDAVRRGENPVLLRELQALEFLAFYESLTA